jgi:GAF domain-containing protein
VRGRANPLWNSARSALSSRSRVGEEREDAAIAPSAQVDILARAFGLEPAGSESAVLRLLIELCAQIVDAQEGSLLVVDESGPGEAPVLTFAMTVGSRESERVLVGQQVPLGEGLVGLAAVTHEAQIGAPLFEGVVQAQRADAPVGQPTSMIAAPMLADGELVGVVTAVTFEPGRRFSEDQARLYARAASVAGLIVQQRRSIAALEGRAEATAGAGGTREEALHHSLDRAIARSAGRLDALERILTALAELLEVNDA